MGSIYIDFPKILRDAGLNVIEIDDDWQYRARSSGGWESNPLAVAWHHSASETSARNDCEYMTYSADAKPIANIYGADNGDVWVMAGGCSNTNGTGDGGTFSRGTCPPDQGNTHFVGMEIGNGGVGQAYSKAQLDSAFTASNAINAYLGNQPTDVTTHYEYTPGRKIDPATAGAAASGGFAPGSINASGTWNNDDLQAECARRAGTLPPTNPPTNPPSEEDEMKLYIGLDDAGTLWIGNGIHRRSLTGDAWAVMWLRSSTGAGPPILSACGNGDPIRDISDLTCHLDHNGLDSLGKVAEDA